MIKPWENGLTHEMFDQVYRRPTKVETLFSWELSPQGLDFWETFFYEEAFNSDESNIQKVWSNRPDVLEILQSWKLPSKITEIEWI